MSDTSEDGTERPPRKEPTRTIDLGTIAGGTGIVVGLGGLLMVAKAFVSAGFNGNIAAILLTGATPTDYLMFMGLLIVHTLPLFAVLAGAVYLPHFMAKGYTLTLSRPLHLFHRKHGYGNIETPKILWAFWLITAGALGIFYFYNAHDSSVTRNFYLYMGAILVVYVYVFHMIMESRKTRRIKRENSLDIVPLVRTQKVKWNALRGRLEAENQRRLLLYMGKLIEAEVKVTKAVQERHERATRNIPKSFIESLVVTMSLVSVFGTPGLWMPWEVITVRQGESVIEHVAQQVNETEQDQTFYLPYEDKILRLGSAELESREYCVPATTYRYVDYGLQKCKRP
ncbi:hypothetical protein [Kocuria sp. LHG3120]|uniref:hypothetical protein n=1 Tax=Kocuria sp. LHG3120 TaxID=2804590 RepID=UPI003CE784C9